MPHSLSVIISARSPIVRFRALYVTFAVNRDLISRLTFGLVSRCASDDPSPPSNKPSAAPDPSSVSSSDSAPFEKSDI